MAISTKKTTPCSTFQLDQLVLAFTHNGLLLLIRRNNFTSKLILQPQDEDRRWNIFWVDLHVDHFPRKDSNMAFHGQLAIVDVDLGHYSEISRRVNWIGRCRSNEKYDSTSAPRFGLIQQNLPLDYTNTWLEIVALTPIQFVLFYLHLVTRQYCFDQPQLDCEKLS